MQVDNQRAAAIDTVYFKVEDPDDDETDLIVDPNGPSGNDNRGGPAVFVTEGGMPASLTNGMLAVPINEQGVATAFVRVPHKPGDNLLLRASTDENFPTSELDSGKITVWRRLAIEFDSMPMPTDIANSVSAAYSLTNTFKVLDDEYAEISVVVPEELSGNDFSFGRVEINGSTYEIANQTQGTPLQILIKGTEVPPSQGNVRLWDDDVHDLLGWPAWKGSPNFVPFAMAGLPKLLAGVNIEPFVATSNDHPILATHAHFTDFNELQGKRDGDTSASYWHAHVLFAFQAGLGKDGDQFEGDTSMGLTSIPGNETGGSIVYVEPFREEIARIANGWNESAKHLFAAIVIHEIGHAWGIKGDYDTEPDVESIMGYGWPRNGKAGNFSPVDRRFIRQSDGPPLKSEVTNALPSILMRARIRSFRCIGNDAARVRERPSDERA